MLKRASFLLMIVGGLLILIIAGRLWAQTIALPNSARAVSGESVIYDFSFAYPDGWQVIDLAGVATGGGALASLAKSEGQPESLIALFVIGAQEMEATGDSLYPFPVQAFNLDADIVRVGQSDITVRRGTLFDERATFIASQALEGGNAVVLQAAVPLELLADSEATYLAILDSVRLEEVRGAVGDAGAAGRLCSYDVTVTISRLQVVNAEESGTGVDFDFDGDQIRLTAGLGALLESGSVDTGLRDEFQLVWESDLASGEVIEDGSIGSIQRVLCEPEVGFALSLVEDDSTPFRRIETRMGGQVVVPILVDGEPATEALSGEYTFNGNTQDGNFEYRVDYTIAYTPVTINAIDLTPTLPPTATLPPSATFTPTLTLSPTATATSSPTLSPVPTDTPTLTATLVPTNTPTMDFTRAAEEFAATQTAFAVTQTAVVATYTPSSTATLSGEVAFFATQTAFASTQNAFLTLSAPTITPTFTASQTKVPTHTPSLTLTVTPSLTLTASRTLTATATFTASRTFTPTFTPSITNTPHPTATATPLPSLTPTPTPVDCPNALQSRLYPGILGRVVPGGTANRLRSQASRQSGEIDLLQGGEEFTVIGGPVCADGFTWFQVNYRGTTGWTVEGNGSNYWLEPVAMRGDVKNVPTVPPDICFAIADGIVNKRNGPGTSYDLVGQMQSSARLEVTGQRTSTSGFLWWQLIDDTWVREDTVRVAGDCANVQGA